jgi:hypothetical protein
MPEGLSQLRKIIEKPGTPTGDFINHLIEWVARYTLYWLAALAIWITIDRIAILVFDYRARKQKSVLEGLAVDQRASRLLGLATSQPFGAFLVVRRIKALARAGVEEVRTPEALSEIDRSRGDSWLVLPRYAASTPVILGLVGTLWGLANGVGSLRPIFKGIERVEQLQELLDAMTRTLGAMTTAFSTSMAGLLVGLLLSLSVTVVAAYHERMLTALDALQTRLAPSLQRNDLAEATKHFVRAFGKSARKLESLTESLQTWTKSLDLALAKNEQASESLERASKAFEDGNQRLSEFQEQYQEVFLQQVHELNGATGHLAHSASGIQTALNAVERKDEAEARRGIERAEFVVSLGEVEARIGELVRRNPELVAQATVSVHQQVKAEYADFVDRLHDSLDEVLSGLREAVERLPGASGRQTSYIREHRGTR